MAIDLRTLLALMQSKGQQSQAQEAFAEVPNNPFFSVEETGTVNPDGTPRGFVRLPSLFGGPNSTVPSVTRAEAAQLRQRRQDRADQTPQTGSILGIPSTTGTSSEEGQTPFERHVAGPVSGFFDRQTQPGGALAPFADAGRAVGRGAQSLFSGIGDAIGRATGRAGTALGEAAGVLPRSPSGAPQISPEVDIITDPDTGLINTEGDREAVRAQTLASAQAKADSGEEPTVEEVTAVITEAAKKKAADAGTSINEAQVEAKAKTLADRLSMDGRIDLLTAGLGILAAAGRGETTLSAIGGGLLQGLQSATAARERQFERDIKERETEVKERGADTDEERTKVMREGLDVQRRGQDIDLFGHLSRIQMAQLKAKAEADKKAGTIKAVDIDVAKGMLNQFNMELPENLTVDDLAASFASDIKLMREQGLSDQEVMSAIIVKMQQTGFKVNPESGFLGFGEPRLGVERTKGVPGQAAQGASTLQTLLSRLAGG